LKILDSFLPKEITIRERQDTVQHVTSTPTHDRLFQSLL
jgi:hypothetical protein